MTSFTTGHDGTPLAWDRVGSDSPRFLFVHATGFCKETWGPLVKAMGEPSGLLVDQRGHGESGPPGEIDWWDLGRDVLSVLADVGSRGIVGVGHSSGGAALAMAEILSPGLFERLVLVEPIIMPPPRVRAEDHPLALLADKRRRSFPSVEAIIDSFRGRGPFVDWDEGALTAYAEHGFTKSDEGWMLRCVPEVEAEFYRTARLHDTWERLGEVGCPVNLVFGSASVADSALHAEDMAGRLPESTLTVLDGAGHLIPMERPEGLAAVVG